MQPVTNSQSLGAIIRAERKTQGLTQEQLAALSGVGIRFVRELELGKESCRLGLTLKVMNTLGLRVEIASRSTS